MPTTAPQTPMARARAAGSVKVLVMIDMATGLSIEPPTACTARKAIRASRFGAREHSSEPSAKTTSPVTKTLRRPIRSAVEPASISSEARTRVYASMTHCSPATEAPRSRRREGRATLSAVLSRLTISRLMQQIARTTSSPAPGELRACELGHVRIVRLTNDRRSTRQWANDRVLPSRHRAAHRAAAGGARPHGRHHQRPLPYPLPRVQRRQGAVRERDDHDTRPGRAQREDDAAHPLRRDRAATLDPAVRGGPGDGRQGRADDRRRGPRRPHRPELRLPGPQGDAEGRRLGPALQAAAAARDPERGRGQHAATCRSR